ncbi:MAG: TolC family protein [Fimbriimonadales bacterium]|nr:TolC family protein [Fimbriimonadales bacterium]MDW8052482.1 TolC family protein [Armatimonadota bacterium]
MRRLIGAWIGVLVLGSATPAQETLSLEEALRLALQQNGVVRAALAESEAAQGRVEAARASLYPSIDLSSSTTRTRLEARGIITDTTQRQNGIGLEWLLLDNGQRELRLRQVSRSAEATRQTTRETIRRVLFQTARAYYEVLRRQELLQVADAAVQRAQTLLEVAKAQAEVGAAPQKDVLQAEADLANARVQQIQARNALRLAQADLRRLIGWDAQRPLPTLKPPESVPALDPNLSVEQLWQRARQQRPDLRAAELALQASQLAVESARLNSLIRLQVSARGFREYDPTTRTQGSLSIIASYPIFDGGLARANLREAEANLISAQQRLLQAERDAYAEVESAVLSLSEAAERLEAARVALAAARRNYEAAQESLREGVGTIVEVLTAQLALVTAETNLVQATYDAAVAELQLRLAVGDKLPQEP